MNHSTPGLPVHHLKGFESFSQKIVQFHNADNSALGKGGFNGVTSITNCQGEDLTRKWRFQMYIHSQVTLDFVFKLINLNFNKKPSIPFQVLSLLSSHLRVFHSPLLAFPYGGLQFPLAPTTHRNYIVPDRIWTLGKVREKGILDWSQVTFVTISSGHSAMSNNPVTPLVNFHFCSVRWQSHTFLSNSSNFLPTLNCQFNPHFS